MEGSLRHRQQQNNRAHRRTGKFGQMFENRDPAATCVVESEESCDISATLKEEQNADYALQTSTR